MEQEKINKMKMSTWFWKWFLNNKVVTVLLIILLISLNFLVFPKIMYIFNPLKDFISIIGLPVLMAGILYYLFNPLIDWMEKKKIPRLASISMVFVVITGLIVWGITILVPIIKEETMSLVANWPTYWEKAVIQFENLLRSTIFSQLQSQVTDLNQSLSSALSEQTENIVNTTFSGIGNVVGTVTTVFIGIVTMPILLFFLLKDGRNMPYHLMKFLPTKIRSNTYGLLKEINTKISQYIRGQLLVAFFVGLMFWIGFMIIGLEYAVLLAVLAGMLNLVPYLGSFLAMIPIIIVALVTSPIMLVKVIIVFSIEQILEGRVVQPLILGSNLKIHPVTIIFILLTAGKVFGVLGVILGIPAYAVLKVIAEHVFERYQVTSGFYDDDYNPAPKPMIRVSNKKKKSTKI